jgi:hypothetical protein
MHSTRKALLVTIFSQEIKIPENIFLPIFQANSGFGY